MTKSVNAFVDNRGNLHVTLISAVIADLAETLGRVGDEGGITEGVARLILSKREEIEKAFSDLDALGSEKSISVEGSDDGVVQVVDIGSKKASVGAAA